MKVTEINWEKAPKDGYALAYFRQNILFRKLEPEVRQQISEQQENLLELHVFDSEQEYRLIKCETGEFIEAMVSDEAAEDKKVETVQVEDRYQGLMKHLQVVNYINYDESGMLSINNYRFALAEGGR